MTETEAIRANYNLGVLAGAMREQNRIIEWLNNRVCFDHKETGNCTHSACFDNRDLVVFIQEGK